MSANCITKLILSFLNPRFHVLHASLIGIWCRLAKYSAGEQFVKTRSAIYLPYTRSKCWWIHISERFIFCIWWHTWRCVANGAPCTVARHVRFFYQHFKQWLSLSGILLESTCRLPEMIRIYLPFFGSTQNSEKNEKATNRLYLMRKYQSKKKSRT